jgi:hypothetical protein
VPKTTAIVKISKPFFDDLISKASYPIVRDEDEYVVVKIGCGNNYRGDDETIVFEISNELGATPRNMPWTILWDEFDY